MPDSLHQYVSKLEVGQNPDAINKFPQTTLWNKVTLSSVRKRQFGSADTVLNAAIAHTTALAGGSTCQNAVIEVQYTITHTNAGVVSSVSAAVVLADLVSSHGAVRQSFSVAYAGAAGSRYVAKRRGLTMHPALTTLSMLLPSRCRPRSGNPGYTVGLPVLVGRMQMTATKRAITERPGGLKLFGASADGSCSTTSATPVAFNEDVRVGCTKKLNYAGLKALCETSQQNRIPIQLNVTDDYVGTLGNSDPHFVEEWLKIGGKWDDALGSLPTFTAETGVCKGLIMGLEYRVLYANIGANTNPQRKVVAVTASYKLGTWQFMLENLVRVASTFARRARVQLGAEALGWRPAYTFEKLVAAANASGAPPPTTPPCRMRSKGLSFTAQ